MRLDRDELLRLVERLVVATITPEEQQRLEEILKAHPDARRLYFAYLDLDLGLRALRPNRPGEIPPPVSFPVQPAAVSDVRRSGLGSSALGVIIGVAAGTLVAAALLLFLAWRGTAPPARSPRTAGDWLATSPEADVQDVATLLFADECRWQTEGRDPVEGQRLARGELHLVQGLALVRFDGGAAALLSGDVRLELETRGSARLHRGRLTVRAPDEAVGFTVRTPASDVVDLGTEFAVQVAPSGATELHVLDGAVEYRKPAERPGSGELLHGGQAIRFDRADQANPRPVAMNAKPLEVLLREAKPKPREDLLLVYEGFQYDVGPMPVAAGDGGWGWSGPWRLRQAAESSAREPDATTELLIAFQKLNVPWPIRGGRAGMLELPPGDNYRVRPLAEPLDLGKDAVYYVSMMMREQPLAATTAADQRREAARLTLRSSEDYWGDRLSFGLPGKQTPHIEAADFIRFTGDPLAEGQSLLWVAKIAARRDGEDEIFFRVYQQGDSLDIVEPADWSVVARGVRSAARLDLLMLSSTGRTRRWFDELRIGTSWRAVVPIARRMTIEGSGEASPPAASAEAQSNGRSSP
jgi:hypothetical protein